MTTSTIREPGQPSGTTEPAIRMMNIVTRLSADEFAGRRTGTPGGHAAAAWLASQLADLGATVRRDEFPVAGAVRQLRYTPVLHWTDGRTSRQLVHRRDFAEHLASADLPQPTSGPLRPIATGDPRHAWLLDTDFSPERAAEAAAAGALGIVVPRGVDEGGWMPKMIAGPATVALPVISVRDDIHQHMTTGADTQSAIMTASVPLHAVDVTAINIHGIFTTAQAGAMSVLLTAHYDGVGDDPALRHPGAGDNASGVAVVIEAAHVLATTTPAIGVAVALLDAEEAGLHGSARHAPHVPAGTVVINLDGAATLDEPAAVEAGGPAHALLLALDQAARQTGVPLRAMAWRSDNRRYAAAGLPTVGIGMGIPGYQTPAETPNRVQPAVLATAVRLLVATVHNLATTPVVPPEAVISEIAHDELAQLIDQGAITVVEALPEDVYARGHLPGALNIRPRRVDELAPVVLPDPAAAIAVYCGDATCDASLRVARQLTRLGYHNVRRYTGGKQDWVDNGRDLETTANRARLAPDGGQQR
jgi:aminopeptidase YwaD